MSFLFGNTAGLPDQKPKPLGIDERRVSTNEQARPVPYFAGKIRVAVTFISDIFDVRTEVITRDIGKQKTKIGNNYYASFAALIGHGPLNGMHEVVLNGETVWAGTLVRDGSHVDYADLTIPGFGLAKIYWGTETQLPDAYLSDKSGIKHPAYRGLAYMVFYRHFFGFNQTNVQNIEVVVSRYPDISWLPSHEKVGDGVNPMVCVAEWFQNPRLGLGVTDDYFDTSGIAATADLLADEEFGISPWLTRAQDCRQLLVQLLEYIDGFTIPKPDGRVSIGLGRAPASEAALPLVDETVMTKKLETAPEEWSGTYNETRVKFVNADNDFAEDAVSYRDRGNFYITGEYSPLTLDRSWVTNRTKAQNIAVAAGRLAALPEITGQLMLRKVAELFAALTPGAMFRLSYAPRGYVDLLCRVTERTVSKPEQPEFGVSFKIDRSYLIPNFELPSDHSPKSFPDPEFHLSVIASAKVLELPLALCPEGILSLAVLAVRPHALVTGFRVHLGHNYDFGGMITPESFEILGGQTRFAIHGTVEEEYADSTDVVDDTVGLLVRLDGLDKTLGEVDEFDGLTDELLVFVEDEMLSVFRIELVDVDLYRLFCIRARFDTVKATHASAAEVFITERANIQAWQHAHFRTDNAVVLKLQSVSRTDVSELSDAFEWDGNIAGRIYRAARFEPWFHFRAQSLSQAEGTSVAVLKDVNRGSITATADDAEATIVAGPGGKKALYLNGEFYNFSANPDRNCTVFLVFNKPTSNSHAILFATPAFIIYSNETSCSGWGVRFRGMYFNCAGNSVGSGFVVVAARINVAASRVDLFNGQGEKSTFDASSGSDDANGNATMGADAGNASGQPANAKLAEQIIHTTGDDDLTDREVVAKINELAGYYAL